MFLPFADILTAGTVLGLVASISLFFKTKTGAKVGTYFPTPFWVYFLSIVFSSFGILPKNSLFYAWAGLHLLPLAIFLMLIGTPVTSLFKMGSSALLAMALATVTMFFSGLVSYGVFARFLPEESWKAVGALLGTWIGGSANMIAVKEIVGLSDAALAPLIIVDTILSYGWLALLFLGVAWQKRFDQGPAFSDFTNSDINESSHYSQNMISMIRSFFLVFLVGFLFAEIFIQIGTVFSKYFSFLTKSAWVLLVASTLTVLLALTPLRKCEAWQASKAGSFILYLVLVTMGAKTGLEATGAAPIFIVFGIFMLVFHGVLLFVLGRLLKLPLFLLATASQANVGGAVSAPILATAYRPGTAHVGVLMAIMGLLFGTYLGVGGAYLCRIIEGGIR